MCHIVYISILRTYLIEHLEKVNYYIFNMNDIFRHVPNKLSRFVQFSFDKPFSLLEINFHKCLNGNVVCKWMNFQFNSLMRTGRLDVR